MVELDKNNKKGSSNTTFKSVCQMCGYSMCGINVDLEDDKIVEITPMKKFPFNKGNLCPKGYASKELQYHPERLKYPLKKVVDRWVRITWDEALTYIVEKLLDITSQYGSESLCLVTGDCKLNESEWHLIKRFMNLFGTQNIVTPATVCQYPRSFVDILTVGSPFHRYFDLTKTDFILCWGSNPSVSHFSTTWMDILRARNRGAKLAVIDPRVTDTAAIADIHIQPRPGTDGALALGILNVIIEERIYDESFVERWTVGFEGLVELVKDFTPEKVEEITWVPKHMIERIARKYATKEKACMFLGNSLDHSTNGIQSMRAIDLIIIITGHLDISGGNIFFPSIPLADISLSGKLPKDVSKIGIEEYPLFNAGIQMGALMDALITEKPYPIKAMIVNYMNPMLSWPDTRNVEKGLRNLDLLVVMDLFMTPTAELANIVLPAATFFERTRLLTHCGRPSLSGGKTTSYITLAQKIVEPSWECRSDWKFWVGLARKLGYHRYFQWRDIEDMIEEQLTSTGFTVKDLKMHPEGVYYGTSKEHRNYEKIGFKTPSGKAEIHSSIFEKFGYDPLPTYKEPMESPVSNPILADKYPLILFTGGKVRAYTQSSWRALKGLKRLEPYPIVEINEKTAEELEIRNDEKVIVETLRGSIKVNARVTDKILPGVVHVQHGWPEGNANLLTDYTMRDPVLGCMALKTMLCRIQKSN